MGKQPQALPSKQAEYFSTKCPRNRNFQKTLDKLSEFYSNNIVGLVAKTCHHFRGFAGIKEYLPSLNNLCQKF